MSEHADCVEKAVTAYQRRLLALAYSWLRNLDAAKDAVQHAFLQLARGNCPAIINHEAWLVTVCRHRVGKVLRQARRLEALTPAVMEAIPDPRDYRHEEQDPKFGALLTQLESLPEKQREVLRLHYFTGLRLKEIAVVLGSEANAVHQAHFAGLRSLQKKMSAFRPIP